jgi:hypothetical protein
VAYSGSITPLFFFANRSMHQSLSGPPSAAPMMAPIKGPIPVLHACG